MYSDLFKMAATAADASSVGMSYYLIILVVMFAFMYFIMIRPQRKQEKEKAAMMAALAVGDSVRTTGGFIGTVIDIHDNMVIIEFGNNKNCRIPMVKEAIVEIEKPEDAVKPVETKADKKKKD